MPDELTPFAVELITRCPQLINLFADKVNSLINNLEHDEEDLKPAECVIPKYCDYPKERQADIQDLLSHVGYDDAQCGYDK